MKPAHLVIKLANIYGDPTILDTEDMVVREEKKEDKSPIALLPAGNTGLI